MLRARGALPAAASANAMLALRAFGAMAGRIIRRHARIHLAGDSGS